MRCHAHRRCVPEVTTPMRPLPGLFANRLFRYPHVRFLRFGRCFRAPSFSLVRPGRRLWPVLHDCIAGCRGACARTATQCDHGNPAKLAADCGGRRQGTTPAGACQRCGRLPQDHSRFLRNSQRWQQQRSGVARPVRLASAAAHRWWADDRRLSGADGRTQFLHLARNL